MKHAKELMKEVDELRDRLQKTEATVQELAAVVSRFRDVENRSQGLQGLTPRQFESAFYLMHLGTMLKVAELMGVTYQSVAGFMVHVRDQLDIVRGARTKATSLRITEAFKTLEDDMYPVLSGGHTKEAMEKTVNDYKKAHP